MCRPRHRSVDAVIQPPIIDAGVDTIAEIGTMEEAVLGEVRRLGGIRRRADG